jgi:hypothetical protein
VGGTGRQTNLAYVAVGRSCDGGGGQERQAVVLAGESVGGVDFAVAARAEGGLVGAAEHARLGRLARGAEHLHRPDAAGATMNGVPAVGRGGGRRSGREASRNG